MNWDAVSALAESVGAVGVVALVLGARAQRRVPVPYRMGMIDDSLWSGWDDFFHHYLNSPGMVWYCQRRRDFCDPEFQVFVDDLHTRKPEGPLRTTQLARS